MPAFTHIIVDGLTLTILANGESIGVPLTAAKALEIADELREAALTQARYQIDHQNDGLLLEALTVQPGGEVKPASEITFDRVPA